MAGDRVDALMRLAVVGRGLMGAAAARHLALGGHDVTLIGPGEPADRATHRGVFASHYDEGRITRLLDPHPVWETLAAASLARYRDIEAASGIAFYTEAGLLIGAPDGDPYLDRVRAVRDAAGVPSAELRGAALEAAFPFLWFEGRTVMLHQDRDAGFISARRMVAAQTEAARRAGATVVDATARSVAGGVVETDAGARRFDRVLVAAGGFSNMLLERPVAQEVFGRTIALFELDAAEAARLSAMPSVIFRVPDNSNPYVLPPMRYPDGRVYLKIGGEPIDLEMKTTETLCAWFRTEGSAEVGAYLEERIRRLVPGLSVVSSHTDTCCVTYTPNRLPHIGQVDEHVWVCTGGNAGAAKSADEIGRIGAESLLGRQDPRFEVTFQDE